jgi:hypothetical protein
MFESHDNESTVFSPIPNNDRAGATPRGGSAHEKQKRRGFAAKHFFRSAVAEQVDNDTRSNDEDEPIRTAGATSMRP